MQPTHHPNRPLSSVPASQPDPARAGRIVATPGLPFEHYCGVCGPWGALCLAYDPATGSDGTWFCEAHVPASFHRYRGA